MTRALTFFALVLALLVEGCTHYEPLSLHGAGSMRVEVEVYKGPLTVPIDGQVGELVAVLSDSIHALDAWRTEADMMRQKLNCKQNEKNAASLPPNELRDCRALDSAIDSGGDMLDFACYMVKTPTLGETVGASVYVPRETCARLSTEKEKQKAALDIPITITMGSLYFSRLREKFDACKKIYDKLTLDQKKATPEIQFELHCQGEIIAIAFDNLATVMRAAAFRAADANIRSVPRSREVRGLITALAFMASEYGNQVQARITVLQKQLAPIDPSKPLDDPANLKPRDPKTMPVSDYLRDAGKTDFIQLYDWLSATTDGGFGAPHYGKLNTEERIRMAQRLTNDYFWQKINEVYASGQGDVSMAFIKDDLGNWDLKSFSNDPSALLRSYRRVTDAVLASAAKLARTAATGGTGAAASAAVAKIGAAARAANLANQLAGGQSIDAQAAPGFDLASVHTRVTARLAAQKLRFQAQAQTLSDQITANTQALSDANAAHDALPTDADAVMIAAANGKVEAAKVALAVSQQRLKDLPKDAVAAVQETLQDHLATVAAMQEGIAGSAAAPAAPTTSAR